MARTSSSKENAHHSKHHRKHHSHRGSDDARTPLARLNEDLSMKERLIRAEVHRILSDEEDEDDTSQREIRHEGAQYNGPEHGNVEGELNDEGSDQ
ncbi:hypothetical protein GGX14DRAFT_575811 [Mycena pura]|uniref:Uncharacterized protein n=1 Tax=Mycena pura TaxID=153505 RepID=A0AAD6UUV5_9AGAR|nr:hypothetical protein GGX14DRAFT_575811 [Mycena pura]